MTLKTVSRKSVEVSKNFEKIKNAKKYAKKLTTQMYTKNQFKKRIDKGKICNDISIYAVSRAGMTARIARNAKKIKTN